MSISPQTKQIFLIEPDDRMRDRVEAVLMGLGYEVAAPGGADPSTDDLQRREYDAIVVVDAPIEERRRRAMASRGWTAEEFDAIDSSQMSAELKRGQADHFIMNSGDQEALERIARTAWDGIIGSCSNAAPRARD